ncbi:uncharacterized protein DS421_2g46330 [Arachis hypogaea]|nr:uncharacterized protein DS421_2g46330 [Arachis hypogaea]
MGVFFFVLFSSFRMCFFSLILHVCMFFARFSCVFGFFIYFVFFARFTRVFFSVFRSIRTCLCFFIFYFFVFHSFRTCVYVSVFFL